MGIVRFIGWRNFWHVCGECSKLARPCFHIENRIDRSEQYVCTYCYHALLDLSKHDWGIK